MAQFETLNQQNSDELRRYLFQLKADIENTINLMEDDQARFRQEVKTNNDALKREMQDVINKINSSSAVGEVYHKDTELAQGDISDSDEMPIYDASASTYKKTLFSSLKAKFWGYVQTQLATVATSGSYNDLSNKPNLATVATSGNYNDLSNKPNLNYLPLNGGTMTGALKFANGSSTENPNMPYFLGIDGFADGGEVHWIYANQTADAIGALKKSGGTMTGKIERSGGGSWIKSRDNVAVMGSSYGQASGNSFNVSVGQKTTSGAWVMGNLSGGEELDFAYTSDANYSSQQNSYKRVRLPLPTGTEVNLITSENMTNYVQKTESRFQGEIASGNSIFKVLKSTTCPWGLSFWYTQHADDAPRKGSVSFTIINKPTSGGTYAHIYFFSDTHLYIALTGSALPSALSFTQIF